MLKIGRVGLVNSPETIGELYNNILFSANINLSIVFYEVD